MDATDALELERVAISCDCDICRVNAETVGASFPLRAVVNGKMAAGLKITPRNADRASKVHGLVHTAYDPSLKGAGLLEKWGPWPAADEPGATDAM